MPREVAREMLLAPGARITNRERKMFRAALEDRYEFTRTRKPVEQKVAAKLAKATLAQLAKWLRRAVARRQEVQRAYVLLGKRASKFTDETNPGFLATRHAMTVLDGKAAMLDTFREAVEKAVSLRPGVVVS